MAKPVSPFRNKIATISMPNERGWSSIFIGISCRLCTLGWKCCYVGEGSEELFCKDYVIFFCNKYIFVVVYDYFNTQRTGNFNV